MYLIANNNYYFCLKFFFSKFSIQKTKEKSIDDLLSVKNVSFHHFYAMLGGAGTISGESSIFLMGVAATGATRATGATVVTSAAATGATTTGVADAGAAVPFTTTSVVAG